MAKTPTPLLRLGNEKWRQIGRVTALAYSADGATLYSADEARTVYVWDARSGDCRASYKLPIIMKRRLDVDQVTPELAALSQAAAFVIDPASGAATTLRQNAHGLDTHGSRVAVNDLGNNLEVYENNQVLWQVRGWQPRFSPDGRLLAAVAHMNATKISIFEGATGRLLQTLECELLVAGWSRLYWSADGRRLLAFTDREGIVVFDTQSGERLLSEATGFAPGCTRMLATASPDLERVIVGGYHFDKECAQVISRDRARRPLPENVGAATFSPQGNTIAIGLGNRIALLDAETLQERTTGASTIAFGLTAFSPDGRFVMACDAEGTTALAWDVATGAPVPTDSLPRDAGIYVARRVKTNKGLVLRFESLFAKKVLLETEGETAGQVSFSSQLESAAVSRRDPQSIFNKAPPPPRYPEPLIEILRVADGTGQRIAKVPGGADLLELSHDATLVARRWNQEIHVWDVKTGTQRHTLPLGKLWYWTGLDFSHDASRLKAHEKREVVVWDMSTGAEILRTRVAKPILTTMLNFDGTRIAIADEVGIRIVNTQTGKAIWKVEGRAVALAFSHDGKLLATAGQGSVQVWQL